MLKLYNKISFIFFKLQILIATLFYSIILKNVGKKTKFIGFPSIELFDSNSLIIGSNVTITSIDKYYHILAYSKCKFISNTSFSKIIIGNNTRIHLSCIHSKKLVKIGNNCLIAANCQIIDNNGHQLLMNNPSERINSKSTPKEIIIEDNVWIAMNSIILPGVTIGEGSIITAGSVVKDNIEPFCIAGGNPAIIIKKYKDVK